MAISPQLRDRPEVARLVSAVSGLPDSPRSATLLASWDGSVWTVRVECGAMAETFLISLPLTRETKDVLEALPLDIIAEAAGVRRSR